MRRLSLFLENSRFCYFHAKKTLAVQKSLSEIIQVELFHCNPINFTNLAEAYLDKAFYWLENQGKSVNDLARKYFFRAALSYLLANNKTKFEAIYKERLFDDDYYGYMVKLIYSCLQDNNFSDFKEESLRLIN